jgi:guanylate kinase
MIERGQFVEWARVYGQYYGTSYQTIEERRRSGRDVILVIEAKGAGAIKKKFKDAVRILLLPPSMKELKRRILGRQGAKGDQVEHRLRLAQTEIRRMLRYDYCIVNEDLGKTVKALETIVAAERSRMVRRLKIVNRLISEKVAAT